MPIQMKQRVKSEKLLELFRSILQFGFPYRDQFSISLHI